MLLRSPPIAALRVSVTLLRERLSAGGRLPRTFAGVAASRAPRASSAARRRPPALRRTEFGVVCRTDLPKGAWELTIPAHNAQVTRAAVARWFVEQGDHVQKGGALVQIETATELLTLESDVSLLLTPHGVSRRRRGGGPAPPETSGFVSG
jgi:hypothetical protein